MFEQFQPRPSPIRKWVFGGLIAAVLVGAVVLVSQGLTTTLVAPALYRPTWGQQEALDLWCDGGTVLAHPPNAVCQAESGEVLRQRDFDGFRSELPERRMRPRPLHPGTTSVLLLLLAALVWFGFDRVWDRAERRWVELDERLRRRRAERAAEAQVVQRDVQISAHEVAARMKVLRGWVRALLVGGVALAALYFASQAVGQGVRLPNLEGRKAPRKEALAKWCAKGKLVTRPPLAMCKLHDGPLLTQADFRQFRSELPRQWPRLRAPHPGVTAAILLALAALLWRLFAPVQVRLVPNGVWFGRRFVQADELRGVQISSVLGRPRLVLLTETDPIRSPPLRIPHAELQELCDQIERLVPDRQQADEAVAERERLEPEMRALRAGSAARRGVTACGPRE